MIYGFRSRNLYNANTRIEFKGYEISIAMDDGNRGGHLTRTSIIVYKDERDVTATLGLDKVSDEGIIHPTGEDLLKVMQAIERLEHVPADVSESFSDMVRGARRM